MRVRRARMRVRRGVFIINVFGKPLNYYIYRDATENWSLEDGSKWRYKLVRGVSNVGRVSDSIVFVIGHV